MHGFALKVAQDLYGSLKKWKYVESTGRIMRRCIRINNTPHDQLSRGLQRQHSVCGLQFHRRLSDPVGQDHEQTGIEKSFYLHVHEILRQKNEPALKCNWFRFFVIMIVNAVERCDQGIFPDSRREHKASRESK